MTSRPASSQLDDLYDLLASIETARAERDALQEDQRQLERQISEFRTQVKGTRYSDLPLDQIIKLWQEYYRVQNCIEEAGGSIEQLRERLRQRQAELERIRRLLDRMGKLTAVAKALEKLNGDLNAKSEIAQQILELEQLNRRSEERDAGEKRLISLYEEYTRLKTQAESQIQKMEAVDAKIQAALLLVTDSSGEYGNPSGWQAQLAVSPEKLPASIPLALYHLQSELEALSEEQRRKESGLEAARQEAALHEEEIDHLQQRQVAGERILHDDAGLQAWIERLSSSGNEAGEYALRPGDLLRQLEFQRGKLERLCEILDEEDQDPGNEGSAG